MRRTPETTRALNVLVLSLEYTPKLSGGMGTHVFELCNGLGLAGHRVTTVAYDPGAASKLHRAHGTVHMISEIGTGSLGLGQVSMVKGILAFNRRVVNHVRGLMREGQEKPDIIHYHNWTTFPAAYALGRMLESPTVGTIHFVSEPIEGWWGQSSDPEIVEQEKGLFRRAGTLIAVSESIREIVVATHDLKRDDFFVVHNGFEVERFKNPKINDEAARELRRAIAPGGEHIVMFAGRLNLQKGIEALLHSAARVLSEGHNVRYLVAGEPDSRDFLARIEGWMREYPILDGKVKLVGKVPRNQLATLYQVADIALVPSVYEPFGYAAIEAMAARVPVIASNVGGLGEIIENGRTGVLVPVVQMSSGEHGVDVKALTGAQVKLLQDRELREGLSVAGQRRVEEAFSLGRMVDKTVWVYQSALKKSRSSFSSVGEGGGVTKRERYAAG